MTIMFCSKKRLLIAPARSGTNATSNAFAQDNNNEVWVHGIKNYYGISPKYDFYDTPVQEGKQAKISVESVGRMWPATLYKIFRNAEDIKNTKPVFMLRNPFDTWKSQRANKGMKPYLIGFFKQGYNHVYRMLNDALDIEGSDATAITSEQLKDRSKAEHYFKRICQRWDIPFIPEMINWQYTYDENPNLIGKLNQEFNHNARGTKSYGAKIKSKGDDINLSVREGRIIERDLMPIYERVQALSEELFANTG